MGAGLSAYTPAHLTLLRETSDRRTVRALRSATGLRAPRLGGRLVGCGALPGGEARRRSGVMRA